MKQRNFELTLLLVIVLTVVIVLSLVLNEQIASLVEQIVSTIGKPYATR